MPIGVPKVAYRLPGEPTPQWIDLYNRLYRERVLFLGSDLDDELANQLVDKGYKQSKLFTKEIVQSKVASVYSQFI